MKKIAIRCVFVLLAVCVSVSMLACGNERPVSDETKLKVVTTIFPLYDWTREIIGKDADAHELTLLVDNGIDMHSYQPSVEDIATISTCDVFIYVGGESDEWVEEILASAVNENMVVINVLDVLGDSVKEEEVIEGMEGAAEEESADEAELDEHVWLSLKNVEAFCTYLSETLGALNPDSADSYAANNAAYQEKLAALDGEYRTVIDAAKYDTIVFGDRFPFRYLVDDYDLTYFAAFPGCSAETEASFETITFLAEKMDELGIGSILVIDGSDHAIAQTIIQSTQKKDQQILEIDSMQSVDQDEIASGTSYLSIMEKNLKTLEEALN